MTKPEPGDLHKIHPVFRMPVLFPNAVCMAVELAVYGLVAGVLYKVLPKTKASVFTALITAMICGGAAWGLTMFTALGLTQQNLASKLLSQQR